MSAPLVSGAPWIASLTCPGTTTGGSGNGQPGPVGPAGPSGPPGPPGPAGAAGTSGAGAFTSTTGTFTQPPVSSAVLVSVQNSSWMAVSQVVFVANGGYYRVFNIPNSTSVILINLGYNGNLIPGMLVASNSTIGPGGIAGVANGGIYAGTSADLAAQNPAGPAIWILTDSDPQYQIVAIPG